MGVKGEQSGKVGAGVMFWSLHCFSFMSFLWLQVVYYFVEEPLKLGVGGLERPVISQQQPE